ncbi:RagB/SusD family nutrient uptake outer membrane protein [Flagellimonas meishanensis]|uniref:RagB/SusD family nutrient uptake outer membrane protein n=1 Tax=Flagellimonas meishanensis TaxID=2873264 RepID=UPI001CA6637D|nr:RagB/SusD family nutrient uptake outer membrane protein [[Muricauda] meishanensis]
MKINKIYKLIFILAFGLGLFGCTDDLDNIATNNVNSENAFEDPESYLQFLAKIYAGYSVTGQQGPSGQGDLIGFDEGNSQYTRTYFYLNELTADAVKWRYDDAGVRELLINTWTPDNDVISVVYNRIIFQVTQVNEFLRQTTQSTLDSRNVPADVQADVAFYRAEARFLRALSYYHALELFGGNVPFVTEENLPGAFFPEQTNADDLFSFIEAELLEIADLLVPARQNGYGRADQAAAWTLLARLYLNAEVYIGEDRYSDCLNFCNRVIDAGYVLHPNYNELFLADNNTAQGIIFPITHDGIETQSFGYMFILVNGTLDANINASGDFGANTGGFAALTCKESFVRLFEFPGDDPFQDSPDIRASFFFKDGHSLELTSPPTGSDFQEGFGYTKFRNLTSSGAPGQDNTYPDIDLPLFRLADVYLMYAEAFLRGGGGDEATALGYVNQIRQRAYGDTSGNVTSLDLQFILDERGRELGWEGYRRTDLIRFQQYTGNTYVWDWKGGIENGTSIPDHLKIFPLPSGDLNANPNLDQNPGY